jgi:pilus assembly protein TadC
MADNAGLRAVIILGLVIGAWLLSPQDRSGLLRPGAATVDSHRESKWRQILRPSRLLGALAAGVSAWALFDGWVSFVGGFGLAGIALMVLARLDSRKPEPDLPALRAQLPATLELLAAVVESGSSLDFAVGQVAAVVGGPTGKLLQRVTAALGVGCTSKEAWDCLRDHEVWGTVSRELARCAESGLATASVLRGTAVQARKQHGHELMRQARATGVRSSLPLVACYLPAFLLVGVVPIIGGLVGQYLS